MIKDKMLARIFKPTQSAMTSGQAKTQEWVLEYAPHSARKIDPLMGWSGNGDTESQIKLYFATKEDAVNYAEARNIAYQIYECQKRKHNVRKGGYSENFSVNRRNAWTH